MISFEESDNDPQTPSTRANCEDSPDIEDIPSGVDHITPLKRRKRGTSSVSTTVKQRTRKKNLRALDLYPTDREIEPSRDDICVVTRFNGLMDVIEFAHVVPKVTSSETIGKLEWVWGLKSHTLNVDSSRNLHVCALQVSVHRLFDKPMGGLSWVPSANLLRNLDKYYGQSTRYDPEKVYNGKTIFQYKLFAFPDMKHCCAIRQYDHLYETIDLDQIIQYPYPFPTFDNMSLTVPPHFVIYNTGLKLDTIFKDREPTHEELQLELSTNRGIATRLGLCLSIYRRWMLSNPPDEFPSLHSPTTQAGPSKQGPPPPPRSTRSRQPSGRSHKSVLGSGGASKRGGADGGFNDASTTLPDDSISCISGSVEYSEESDDDFEEDDAEFLQRIVEWAENVWEKTRYPSDDATIDSIHDNLTCVDLLENGDKGGGGVGGLDEDVRERIQHVSTFPLNDFFQSRTFRMAQAV